MSRLQRAREAYEAGPDEALALLGTGDSIPDAAIPTAELAAHAIVCAVILNLDEVLTRP